MSLHSSRSRTSSYLAYTQQNIHAGFSKLRRSFQRKTQRQIDSVSPRTGKPSRPGLYTLNDRPPRDSDFSIVLIHDVALNNEDTWSKEFQEDHTWASDFPQAEVLSYGYDVGTTTQLQLCDLLDPNRLESNARTFLSLLGKRLGHCDASSNTTTGLDELQQAEVKRRSRRPIVVLAHGYGGLIYETALELSYREAETQNPSHIKSFFAHQKQLAFLFGTPHFAAGLGEWAIMCGRRLGLDCAKTATEQAWTPKIARSVARISDTQSALAQHYTQAQHGSERTVAIAGCFATLPDRDTDLILSPDWAVMPEFTTIPIHGEHLNMTNPRRENDDLRRVFEVYNTWLSDIKFPLRPSF